MEVNIKSENQSGGITAQNVNIGNGNKSPAPPPEGKKIARVIAVLLGAVASTIAIYKFFS